MCCLLVCSVAEASAATLREMNPLVKIAALPGSLPGDPDHGFLRGFDAVLLTSAPLNVALQYDNACRELGVAFYTASSRGSTSFFFADLLSHTYSPLVCTNTCALPYRSSVTTYQLDKYTAALCNVRLCLKRGNFVGGRSHHLA